MNLTEQSAWLAPEQLASLIGVKPLTLANWRAHHKGPAYHRFGRTIRYHADDVAAWMASQRHDREITTPPVATAPKRRPRLGGYTTKRDRTVQ
jgi:hypothetical protein